MSVSVFVMFVGAMLFYFVVSVCCICGILTLIFFFFFFKQKTAYEIYQCDWSSDVCSSDLELTSVDKSAFYLKYYKITQ